MTLIEFTIDGDSSTDGSQAFTLAHTYTFRTMRLKHVIFTIGNDSLQQSWSSSTTGVSAPSSRSMYAPLYLDVSGLGVEASDQYYYASDGTYNAAGLVAIGHATSNYGTSDNTNKMSHLGVDLIKNEETTWTKGDTVTLAVKYAPVEYSGTFGTPQAFSSTSWDDTCRITVALELDDMQVHDDGAGTRREWVY
eukprot:COSAG04_NODE_1154_length_8051_cov_26.213531_8_plen_193_part_00